MYCRWCNRGKRRRPGWCERDRRRTAPLPHCKLSTVLANIQGKQRVRTFKGRIMLCASGRLRRTLIAGMLVCLVTPALAAAGVVKWTDANGQVHYSDHAPSDQKTQEVKTPPAPKTLPTPPKPDPEPE